MSFGQPYFLLLLLLLPLLAWLKGKRGQPPAFVYSSVQLVRGILNLSPRPSRVAFSPPCAGWRSSCLSSLWPSRASPGARPRSMPAASISPWPWISPAVWPRKISRFAAAASTGLKWPSEVLKKFIDKRPSDRIGIVAFATLAYIAAPLTLDHEFLLR